MPSQRARFGLIALGFETAVAQACLLREAMAALGGSELAWGGVLTLWLVGMGCGAALATRRSTATGRGGVGSIVVPLCALAGVVILRAAPALVGVAPGEVTSTLSTLWIWVVAVLPAALAGGFALPVLASGLGDGDGAGRAYAFESAGAMLGGVAFTFVLAPFGSVAALQIAIGLAGGLLSVLYQRRLLGFCVLALCIALASASGESLAIMGWRWAGRTDKLGVWRETRQQRIEVSASAPHAIYGDGRLLGTYPDPYRSATRAHLALLLHPSPRRVLVVAGIIDGSLVSILRHLVQRVDVVVDDPGILSVVPAWSDAALAGALRDERLHVQSGEALRAIADGGPWDLVLLLDQDPTTLRGNRTRTVELMRLLSGRLADDGIVALRVGVADTYLGGTGGELLGTLAATMKQVFPVVVGVPGEEVMLVGGRGVREPTLDAAALVARWHQRRIVDAAFPPELIPQLVEPERAAALAEFLRANVASPNRASRPRAVLLAASLSEARGAPWLLVAARWIAAASGWLAWLLLALPLFPLAASRVRGRLPGGTIAVVVGYSSMGWWLLLLDAWQATVGSVYAEIGGLSAAFMAGLVGGTTVGVARGWRDRRPLVALLLCGAAVSIVIGSGLPLLWPRLVVVPLLVVAGLLTGAAFPSIAALAGGRDARVGVGRGFAGDEVGAALAAALIGVAVVPWAGVTICAAGLALVSVVAALVVALPTRASSG